MNFIDLILFSLFITQVISFCNIKNINFLDQREFKSSLILRESISSKPTLNHNVENIWSKIKAWDRQCLYPFATANERFALAWKDFKHNPYKYLSIPLSAAIIGRNNTFFFFQYMDLYTLEYTTDSFPTTSFTLKLR
jgi:hypothetical protein